MRAIFLLVFSLPTALAVEQTCPWLNAATAGGVLEGPVRATVAKNGESASCEFVRQNSTEKLRIEVVTIDASGGELLAYKAQCVPPLVPLKAIGNEAVACAIETKNGRAAEQVVGRVRQQAFLIRVSSVDQSAEARSMLREKAIKIAEHVAGNLF